MAFQHAPPPNSPLARYRVLSPTASVHVSPLCLGAMNFGNAWKGFMGSCDQTQTEAILDLFYEQGGNFIDTSNNYQSEESETWIGEWMAKRGNRDQMGKLRLKLQWEVAHRLLTPSLCKFWQPSTPLTSVLDTMTRSW
jgi:predicted aldo/keto reductase-like oxidoreductase